MIQVTKSYLPPKDEFLSYLDQVWESRWLTNNGPLVQMLNDRLKKTLDISNINCVSNGTIAIQLALRGLGISSGEIITTPFSYVATVSAIMLEGCTPVFVDIDRDTLCIDADNIEAKINKNTKAIMGVHVFGRPCDVHKIEQIAEKHNIKVIYDAAHAFGAIHNNQSLLSYGDISTCSFHATKLFHTVEGGCVITDNKELHDKISLIMRFGHTGDDHHCLGTNGKMSEVHAAMGLANLNHFDEILAARKKIYNLYVKELAEVVTIPQYNNLDGYNYAYFPILLKNEKELLDVQTALNEKSVYPRRYFYPSLNELPYLAEANSCPISEDISRRVLSLPFYPDLDHEMVVEISRIIRGVVT